MIWLKIRKLIQRLKTNRDDFKPSQSKKAGLNEDHKRILMCLFKVGVWLSAFGMTSFVLAICGVFLYLDPRNPEAATYRNYQYEQPMRIFSAEGALLAEFGERRLIPIDIEDVPDLYLRAVVATEDKRFYSHGGIDWISFANDALDFVFTDNAKRGASTITMQLPRNVADLTRDQTIVRKLREMLLAIRIENDLTKEEILELYVNVVPFGKRAHGVQAAAFTYYGKPVDKLNIAQIAMLAGIPKRPEAGNPINGPEYAMNRRNLVLRRMRDDGVITVDEYETARQQPLSARVHSRKLDLPAPYPAEVVRQEMVELFGKEIYSGYSIYTTIDHEHQLAAQNALRTELENYDRLRGYRGPERHIEDVEDENARVRYLNELKSEIDVGLLVPAVVTHVAERSIQALLRNGTEITVPWKGLSWARRSLGSAGVARRPRNAGEVVRVGDVIRIKANDEEQWKLTQVPEVQGAIVAIEPRTGAITAMVGGYNFNISQYNHATQAKRQPGSGFKPFVYTAALANGVTPASIFLDAPLVFNDEGLETAYRPRNFSGTYNGPTRVREALYRSINLVSIRVLETIGATPARDFIERFGFNEEEMPNNTQLAIGGGGLAVSPLDMATAYAVFANGGYRVEPHLVEKVVSLDNEVVYAPIYPTVCDSCGYSDTEWNLEDWQQSDEFEMTEVEHTPTEENAESVLDPRLSFLIDSMLRDVVKLGTARRAQEIGRTDLAGKTGTTNDAVDTWFNGYQQNLVATAWVGFTNRKSLGETEYGSTRPLTIWMDFMDDVLTDTPLYTPVPPDGIVSVYVDPKTGEVAADDQKDAIAEYFLADNAPERSKSQDTTHVKPEDIF